jgi:hypothetical protein
VHVCQILYDDELKGAVFQWLQGQDNDFYIFRDFFSPHEIGEAHQIDGRNSENIFGLSQLLHDWTD